MPTEEDSDIQEGEKVLLMKQAKENKLSPNFETKPYTVESRNGSALILKSVEGQSKMRNIRQVKKFVEPDATGTVDTYVPQNVIELTQTTEGENTPVLEDTIPADPGEVPVEQANSDTIINRPVRHRQEPVWMQDYVSK